MSPTGWTGEETRLIPLDKQRHLENALHWFNDPETSRWLVVGDFPLTRLQEEEYFDKMMRESQTEVPFAIHTLEDDEHIGFCGIHAIEWRHGGAITGTVIGSPDRRGRGFGSDAVAVRTKYAFETLGLRILRSQVMAENEASLRVLEKSGYRAIGRIPGRYWKRGKYRDALIVIAERDEWLKTHASE